LKVFDFCKQFYQVNDQVPPDHTDYRDSGYAGGLPLNHLKDYDFDFVIADNGSTDKTSEIAEKLNQQYPEIKYLFLQKSGKKGGAIKNAWQKFSADYYVFMDIDLSTDLNALPILISELKNGADLVIGSRYLKDSQIKRSLVRLFVSKIYNLFIKLFFHCPLHDLANGFKGANKKIIQEILPLTKNEKWFFDSELTLLSFIKKYKIKEIPVKWNDARKIFQKQTRRFRREKSKVKVINVSIEYLKEIFNLWKSNKKIV